MHEKTCVDCGKMITGHGNAQRCRSCGVRYGYFKKHGKPAEKIIGNCSTCGKEFVDYASNRTKSKTGERFCSYECRAAWVGILNSVTRGGDGVERTKSERDKIYYRENSDKVRDKAKSYYWKNRDRILANKKREDREAKKIVVDEYGGKCECCGESMIEFLTIDHVKNDGAEHRKRVGKGRNIYRDLIKQGFPKGDFRLLCFNCNITRGFYGYCPHNPEDKEPINHTPDVPGRKRIVKETSAIYSVSEKRLM